MNLEAAASFEGSFRIFMEPERPSGRKEEVGCTLDMFSGEVEMVKADLVVLEKMYIRLEESNEEIKNANNAGRLKQVRAQVSMELDEVFKVAKQINKKYDGLVRANAAQRTGGSSSDDQFRASLISGVVESLQSLMRRFQALRTQMETQHRQLIEAKYFAITREKATAEAIDNLISSEVSQESPLHQAMLEFGRAAVMGAVAEIQERRDTMKEVRRNLMALHQIFLGIATPVMAPTPEGGGVRAGLPSPVEKNYNNNNNNDNQAAPAPPAGVFGGGGGGGLNDFERETRKQSYIAILIALLLVAFLVFTVFNVEKFQDGTSKYATDTLINTIFPWLKPDPPKF